MKKRTITLSMSEDMQEELKVLAIKLTGKKNVSGLIALLVTEKLRQLEKEK